MRYFLDTEFIEDAKRRTIDLISIAIVAEDGREFYAISLEFESRRAGDWVRSNVLSKLPPRPPKSPNGGYRPDNVWKTRSQIKHGIIDFIGDDIPEFWGYYAGYDWVAFCWLFGKMIDLPKGWPMYCRDIKQLMDGLGVDGIPFEPAAEHDALSDATWNRRAFDWLSEQAEKLQETR